MLVPVGSEPGFSPLRFAEGPEPAGYLLDRPDPYVVARERSLDEMCRKSRRTVGRHAATMAAEASIPLHAMAGTVVSVSGQPGWSGGVARRLHVGSAAWPVEMP